MSENKLKARFQHAAKTESEWKASNPVLLKGEIAYSTDKKQWKTGDGSSHWADIAYDKAMPTGHTHDDRYYTESEINTKLGGKVDLSADGVTKAINKLSTAAATPTDEDYYISQYAGGGTTTTSYYRRPVKALWAYIQSKLHKVATSGSYNDLSNKPTTGTSSTSGLTKLYTGTGTATDGTMTQAAIKSALDGKASSSHNHSANNLAGGYINTHPENGDAILIPMINNDIAFLLKRGGSAKIYYDSTDKTNSVLNNFSCVFDGTPSYWAVDPTGITKITIELTLHKTFVWTNTIYYDSGSTSWRAKNVTISVMNTKYDTAYKTVATFTNSSSGHNYQKFSYTATGQANAGSGFNKIKFEFSGWGTSNIFRIACLGVWNYGSSGLTETYLSKGGGEVYDGINPFSNAVYDLGTSSKKWKTVYANTFSGALSGNASTSTKATQDSAGQQIDTTYLKGLSISGKTVTYTKGNNSTGTFTLPTASIKQITLLASEWTGSTAPYIQTITSDGISEDDNPILVSMLERDSSIDAQKTYMKAFGIISSGVGVTEKNSITFFVYQKPAIDITIGLMDIW